jgi:dsRNA-specific ribonuclease
MTDLPSGLGAILSRWQRSDHIQLHAGEMTAQEMRSVKAVVKAIEAEITAALAGRVVVPCDPTLKMINAADFYDGMFTSPSTSIEDIYRAMIGAATADLTPSPSPGERHVNNER